MRRRKVELIFDLCCGTARSAALYHLLTNPHARVIGVDRDKSAAWVRKRLPAHVRHRIVLVSRDIKDLDVHELACIVEEAWPGMRWSDVTHVHWSPPCETLSRASRGRSGYRDRFSRPVRSKAIRDDAAFEAGVKLMQGIVRLNPACLATIESPRGPHFIHLPGARSLLDSPGWRLLSGSHCRCAGHLDRGAWPQKDTDYLVYGVGRNFHLPLCEWDCPFLLPGTRRHAVVICRNRSNHPGQHVLTDPMVKGVIPLGVMDRLYRAHLEWLDGRSVPSANSTSFLEQRDGSSSTDESFSASSSSESEEARAEDDESDNEMAQPDPYAPLDEELVGTDGLVTDEVTRPLRDVTEPADTKDSIIKEWALAYPGLLPKGGRWDVEAMQPWMLMFVDTITFDFRVRGKKQYALVVYDLVTGGRRALPLRSKAEAGIEFDKLITRESLDKRKYKVTCSGDGCGSINGLVRDACLARHLDFIPLPPHRPSLNPVEGIIAGFKEDVAACLLPAIRGGGIDESFVMFAAEYVAYTTERWACSRDYRKGDSRTPFELNTGVPPKVGHLVPFGTPGRAYVPKELRAKRGAPKYARSEPVLMIGYQHVYTNVYKCLTQHGTVIHTEQVVWDKDPVLGVFPDVRKNAPGMIHGPPLAEVPDKLLGHPATDKLLGHPATPDPPETPKARPKAAMPKDASGGIIRLNRERVYTPDGTPVPKKYILDRVRQLDGVPVEEARLMRFPDKNGKLKRYSGDLAYDVSTGWILIEMPDAAQHTNAAVAGGHAPQPAPAVGSRTLFTRQWPERPHSDGAFSVAASRRMRRFCGRMLRVRRARLSSRTPHVRGTRMPRRVHRTRADMGRKGAEAHAFAFLAMRDLPWKKYLHGEHHEHIIKAYESEFKSLLDTVLRELHEGDPEFEAAKRLATPCRALLEFKRQGVWKVRCVVQGFAEDKEALDGPDFNYSSDVVGLTTVRAMMLGPRQSDDAIAQMDISTAFLQSNMFEEGEPPRYLRLKDPVTGKLRYFRQLGVVYGSASASKRWQDTLNAWLLSVGFTQGKNEPCVFRHRKLGVTLGTYVDDLLLKGPRAAVDAVLAMVQARFKCKAPSFLEKGSPLDHLGMLFEETDEGTFLSMQHYIETMLVRLDMKNIEPGRVRVPMSKPIEDLTPLSEKDGKFFMRACGMIGWLAGTGRIDLRYVHSRISQHMAKPCVGAMDAVRQVLRYCAATKDLCLWQPRHGTGWSHFSDSDHAGNAEVHNARRSQLGYVSIYGRAPIGWGSKASSVRFGPPEMAVADRSLPSFGHGPTGADASATPVCHPKMPNLHPDVSSAAAEIYAASVALSETLHLGYICDELGVPFDLPVRLEVDNAAAIAFSTDRVRRTKMKHIDVRQEWVRALRDASICELIKVDTKLNHADLLTKILDPDTFETLRDRLMARHQLSA